MFGRGAAGIGRAVKAMAGLTLAAGRAMAAALGPVLAAVAPFALLAAAVKKVGDAFGPIDDAADTAARLGESTENLISLGHAFNFSDASADGMVKALDKMQLNLGKAVSSGGAAEQAFSNLGLSADELSKMPATEALKMISDKLALLPTTAEQSSAAVAIFGKSAKEMLPALTKGSAALEELQGEAKFLGLTFSAAEGDMVGGAVDAVAKTKTAFTGLFAQIAIAVAPAVESVANFLTAAAVEVGKFVKFIAPIFRTMADFAARSLAKAEFALTHWQEVVDIVVLQARLSFETLSQNVSFIFTEQLPQILKTFGTLATGVFERLQHNFRQIGVAIAQSLAQRKIVTPQLLGFEDVFAGAFDDIPSLAERPLSELEVSLAGKLGGALGSFEHGLNEFLSERFGDGLDADLPQGSFEIRPELKESKSSELAKPGALLRGSAEAFSAINEARIRPQQQKLNEIATTLKKLLKVSEDTLDSLEDEEDIELALP